MDLPELVKKVAAAVTAVAVGIGAGTGGYQLAGWVGVVIGLVSVFVGLAYMEETARLEGIRDGAKAGIAEYQKLLAEDKAQQEAKEGAESNGKLPVA